MVRLQFRHGIDVAETNIVGPVTGNQGHVIHPIYLEHVTSFTIYMQGSGAISSLRYSQGCVANSGGDPHFTRWSRQYEERDSFHGECDLVLFQVPHKDFALHVRTTIQMYFSYIAEAAVQIGKHILQVQAANPNVILLDGIPHDLIVDKQGLPVPLTFTDDIDGASYQYVWEDNHSTTTKHVYRLDLSDWSYLRFKMYDRFLTVSIHAGEIEPFQGAVGLLGRFPDGQLVTRDEVLYEAEHDKKDWMYTTTFTDYAMEWQVDPTRGDSTLFHTKRSPQLPYERCRLPTAARPGRRQLLRGNNYADLEKAKEACRRQVDAASSPANFDLCVDDVLTMGDVDLAAIW